MCKIFKEIHKLIKQKKHENVIDELLDDSFNIKPPYSSDLNHAWYILGDIYYRNSNYKFAIKAFLKSLDDWPEDIDAILALSNSYSRAGFPNKSEKYLLKGITLSAENESIIYNLGNAFFDQKKYTMAIDYYKKITNDKELLKLSISNIKKAKSEIKRKKLKQ